MKKTMRYALTLAALGTVVALGLVAAGDDEQYQPSAEEQMMMQKWQAYMTTGEPHAQMAAMAGTWDHVTRLWPQPGMPPQESTGTTTFEMILGGRYMLQHAEGPFMGQTFKGVGITGYDNMKKVYQAMWIDNMGTGMMMSEGTCEDGVCTYFGEAPDVMLGKYKRVKMVIRQVTDDEAVFEMYDKTPEGKEWKNFEMVYHRRK